MKEEIRKGCGRLIKKKTRMRGSVDVFCGTNPLPGESFSDTYYCGDFKDDKLDGCPKK